MDEYLSLYAEAAPTQHHEPAHLPGLDERLCIITILLASYVEALINLYCAFRFDSKQLGAIDRLSPVKKWEVVPSFCERSYKLETSGDLYRDLRSLIDSRNSIAHMRPEFWLGDKKVHPGNTAPLDTISHDSIMQWITLPSRLTMNLKTYDKSQDGQRSSALTKTDPLPLMESEPV